VHPRNALLPPSEVQALPAENATELANATALLQELVSLEVGYCGRLFRRESRVRGRY
jgi:hypothetical protein